MRMKYGIARTTGGNSLLTRTNMKSAVLPLKLVLVNANAAIDANKRLSTATAAATTTLLRRDGKKYWTFRMERNGKPASVTYGSVLGNPDPKGERKMYW